MSDISLIVDTSSVAQAGKDILKLGEGVKSTAKSAQASASVFVNAISKIEKELLAVERSNKNYSRSLMETSKQHQQYINGLLGVEKASRSASQAEKDFAAALRAEEAEISKARTEANKYNNELERLSNKYKPLYAASKQYERALEEINQAHRLGVINTQQHESAVDALGAEYAAFGNGTAGWSNQFVTGSDRAAKAANKFGVVTQQVGYQVGDFLVQVQGGQSVFVAFSQQATQLAGIIPMMTGAFGLSQVALIGLSAALGIGIPLVTALGNVLFTTMKGSKEAGEGVEELKASLKSAREEIRSTTDELELLSLGFKNVFEKTLSEQVDEANAKLAAARDRLKELNALTVEGESETNIGSIYKGRIDSQEELIRLAKEGVAAAEEELAVLQSIYDTKAAMYANDEAQDLQSRLDVLKLELEYGEDSFQVRQEIYLQERDAYEQELLKQGVMADTVLTLLEQRDAVFELTEQLNHSLDISEMMKGILESINISGLIADAQTLANKFAQAAKNAYAMAQAAYDKNLYAASVGRGRGGDPRDFGESNANRLENSFEMQLAAANEYGIGPQIKATAAKKASTKASKASSAAKKAETAAQKELNSLVKDGEAITQKYRTELEKYNDESKELKEHLDAGRISTVTYSRAMEDLQKTLANSKPLVGDLIDAFAEFASQGFKDFEGFVDKVKSLFTNLIKDMIATALRNKILIPIQTAMSGGSGIGSALSGVSGAISGGSGTLGLLGATGAAFGQGATASLSAFASGGLSGGMGFVGTALSQATASLPAFGAALGAAVPVLGALTLGIMAFKTKTKELDAGINLNIKGNELLAESYRKVEKSRFFGLSKSTSTNTSSVDSGPFADAYASIYNGASSAAKALGISSKALDSYTATLNISTKGLDEAEAQAAVLEGLQEAQNGLAEKFFNALGEGSYGLIGAGEELGAAMERIRTTVETVNPLLSELGAYTLKLGLAGANAASSFVNAIGGLDQASSSVGAYIDSFYTAGEKAKIVISQLSKGFSDLGLNGGLPLSKDAFRAIIDRQLAAGQMQNAAGLIKLAPLFDEWISIRAESLSNETNLLRMSAEQRRALLESNLQAEKSLQSEIYELTGNVAALRKIELEGLTGMRRVLQQRIYSLEDAKVATEKAAQAEQDRTAALKAISDEQKGLATELYQALGWTTGLRNMELAALDPSNRALQRRIYAIEDEAAANEKAAVAAQEAADKRAAIAEERKGLIEQMLTLQGKTVELRKRELAELDPTNRSLQMYIYKLEDAQVAADKAAQAEEERLAKQTAIIDERKSLEERLLTLQGNTAELRRRELAALDPTNRAIQLTIYKLEDMQAALEDLDPTKFTTRFEYEMAQARQRVTGISPTSTFSGSSASSTAPVAVVQSDPETIKELKVLRTTVEDLLIKIEDNTGREYGVIREWNRTGLPKERV